MADNPERYTPEQVAQALLDAHGFTSHAARRLGCCPNTIRKYLEKYPEVREARREARESMTDLAEAALYRAVTDGQAWAICFYLKCLAKQRGYVERVEIDADPEDRDTRKWYGDAKTGADELMAELDAAPKA